MQLLQSAAYGIPQSRRRVFFWAAKLGLPLPPFPAPTHAFPANNLDINFPTGESVKGFSSDHAPLASITVQDAIGDLPRFDWQA